MGNGDLERPNILLVTTDQQRGDTVGPASPDFLRTPHVDQLAREGIRFDRAYADCAICVPSRMSIMTGRTVLGHGLDRNGNSSDVVDRASSLPSVLRAAGYQTAAIGKMHFTPERARYGFDEMILPADYYQEMSRSGSAVQPMRHGLGQNELYPGLATVPESATLTSWTAERCVDYIRERRDPQVPFFLWCSFSKPHPPLDPPEPYYSMYQDAAIPEPVVGDWVDDGSAPASFVRAQRNRSYDVMSPEVVRAARVAYYGLVTQVDYTLGRVLAALQDVSELANTLIVFTSDHGEFLGDHRAGGKIFFHQACAQVPMVVRMPQTWSERAHGGWSDALVTAADVFPTIAAAAGADVPAHVEGQDLVSLARGEQQARPYLVSTAEGRYVAVTNGRWALHWFVEGGTEQLFDLVDDPGEVRNRSGDDDPDVRAVRERLRDELVRAFAGTRFVGDDGKLVTYPVGDDTPEDQRNRSWHGWHTEHFPVDVRH